LNTTALDYCVGYIAQLNTGDNNKE